MCARGAAQNRHEGSPSIGGGLVDGVEDLGVCVHLDHQRRRRPRSPAHAPKKTAHPFFPLPPRQQKPPPPVCPPRDGDEQHFRSGARLGPRAPRERLGSGGLPAAAFASAGPGDRGAQASRRRARTPACGVCCSPPTSPPSAPRSRARRSCSGPSAPERSTSRCWFSASRSGCLTGIGVGQLVDVAVEDHVTVSQLPRQTRPPTRR